MLINSLKLKTFAVCHAHMGGCVDQKNRILCTNLIQNFSVRVTPLLQKIVIVIAACQPCAFWKILLIFEVFHCIYNVLKAFAGGKVALSHCICHAHKMRVSVNKSRKHGASVKVNDLILLFIELHNLILIANCKNLPVFCTYCFRI